MVHESWQCDIDYARSKLSPAYLEFLKNDKSYFPDYSNFLNAFKSLHKNKTKAIIFGQDPYPREKSASGYAFIDKAVKELFCNSGTSKEVNRATSLRNFIKMLLVANKKLKADNLTQEAIKEIDKTQMINSIFDLKDNFEKNGILLLNRALIFTNKKQTSLHVKEFSLFIKALLERLSTDSYELILFGTIAKEIKFLLPAKHNFTFFESMHPYNISFINDKKVLDYFSQMNLLSK